MKRASPEADKMRRQYKRSDFGELVRGKYAARVAAETNVVVLEPAVARAFPNEKAVNDALRGLLEMAEATARLTGGLTRVRRRRRPAPTGGLG